MKNRIRKILKENQVHWSKQYEPFRYKENAERLGGSLDWKEKDEWDEDENIKKWEKEERLHAAPLENFTYGVYVLKGDDEVIDYVLNKFGN
jgi:hypothetical protein|tara:strand:- start:342 stop:614 length:273 start_codon:yes stop_codon:yes gene_type:complete